MAEVTGYKLPNNETFIAVKTASKTRNILITSDGKAKYLPTDYVSGGELFNAIEAVMTNDPNSHGEGYLDMNELEWLNITIESAGI